MKLRSYPKVWNLGHPAIADLFDGPVVVQEKVDGSQFTFGVIDGVLNCRSKGATIHLPTTDKLFRGATETAQRLFEDGALVEGWAYRGEAMMGPKHNTLAYERAPKGNIILFDIDVGLEDRVRDPEMLKAQAEAVGLEVVPTMFTGGVADLEALKKLLETTSCLGGAKVEGVVIKNYARWGKDGKMLMGKIVSEAFREKHQKSWKTGGKADILQAIKDTYRHERRWEKAVERLRDTGELQHAPQDIGPLLKAVSQDVLEECRDEIATRLFDYYWKDISRGIVAGLPEWYKERLAERQFSE